MLPISSITRVDSPRPQLLDTLCQIPHQFLPHLVRHYSQWPCIIKLLGNLGHLHSIPSGPSWPTYLRSFYCLIFYFTCEMEASFIVHYFLFSVFLLESCAVWAQTLYYEGFLHESYVIKVYIKLLPITVYRLLLQKFVTTEAGAISQENVHYSLFLIISCWNVVTGFHKRIRIESRSCMWFVSRFSHVTLKNLHMIRLKS